MVAPFDVVLVLFIGALALWGWRSGLIHESATFVGFALGLVLAGRFNADVGPLFVRWVGNRSLADLAAFLAILAGTWILAGIAAAILRDTLRGLRLGWIDSMGGLVLGAAKALFMAEIVTLVLMAMPNETLHNAVQRSWLGSRLAALGPDLVHFVPAVLRYWKPF
ncbi:MAG TPA: CvpA family protein [Anaerolineae bacterium]|nr:CvpA family protein [Anaerolineae bacterium]HOR01023.1 CvpA family protein [Anaerolineae bacterium]HPL29171.1 CvpA family protein [Anaerolineae bacterium]